MTPLSLDQLKGFLIKIEFNFDTKSYDFQLGLPDTWVVDFGINEINIEKINVINGAILYSISSSTLESDLIIKYVINIIKHNKKVAFAKEKIEEQKRKLEQKLLKEGKNFIFKEMRKIKFLPPANTGVTENYISNIVDIKYVNVDESRQD